MDGSSGDSSSSNNENAVTDWTVKKTISDELVEITNGVKTIKVMTDDLSDWVKE